MPPVWQAPVLQPPVWQALLAGSGDHLSDTLPDRGKVEEEIVMIWQQVLGLDTPAGRSELILTLGARQLQ